jgi:prefoldin subunit 5
MESTREASLLKQQIEFVNKKLEDLNKKLQENDLCEESIKSIKHKYKKYFLKFFYNLKFIIFYP